MKRRCSVPSQVDPATASKRLRRAISYSPPPTTQKLPLTTENLRILDASGGIVTAPAMSPTTPGKSTRGASTVSSADVNRTTALLEAYGIEEQRQSAPKPYGVRALLQFIEDTRSAHEITPKSKRVAEDQFATRHCSERAALSALSGLLTYDPKPYEHSATGEDLVHIGMDQQWKDCVPRPKADSTDSEARLKALHKNVGDPPKPKPDVIHGYAQHAIAQENLKVAVISLPDDALPCRDQPWFPYLLCEHEASQPMEQARLQAMKDCAAATHCLHRALEETTQTSPPPEATATFSMCVDTDTVALRIHWRDEQPGQGVRWLSSVVGPDNGGLAFMAKGEEVFRVRSYVLKILEWAQTSRWEMLKAALSKSRLQSSLPGPLPTGLTTPPVSYTEENVEQSLAVGKKRKL